MVDLNEMDENGKKATSDEHKKEKKQKWTERVILLIFALFAILGALTTFSNRNQTKSTNFEQQVKKDDETSVNKPQPTQIATTKQNFQYSDATKHRVEKFLANNKDVDLSLCVTLNSAGEFSVSHYNYMLDSASAGLKDALERILPPTAADAITREFMGRFERKVDSLSSPLPKPLAFTDEIKNAIAKYLKNTQKTVIVNKTYYATQDTLLIYLKVNPRTNMLEGFTILDRKFNPVPENVILNFIDMLNKVGEKEAALNDRQMKEILDRCLAEGKEPLRNRTGVDFTYKDVVKSFSRVQKMAALKEKQPINAAGFPQKVGRS